jgi:acetylornithine deacetylase/succinyl-diaminopimelate desuccinylase-like protein
MKRAVDLLYDWCAVPAIAGLTREVVTLPGRTPVLWVEVPATGGASGTVLMYGHYDKQPEFTGWEAGLGPWQPVLREGRLYGRGGADDGYALFASLAAIAALQDQRLPHARCVILIEGCEESGSFDLPHYTAALAGRIGDPDLVVCLDAECGNYDQLWLTTSLRGLLRGTLTVEILTEGQHSGAAGGIVPSSFRILRALMERIERASDGLLPEALHVEIPPAAVAEARAIAQVLGPGILHRFPWVEGAGPDTDDVADLLITNTWRPSLATVGISGAPAVNDAGNTLRPGTSTKLAIRLPPTLDAHTACERIQTILERDPPYGAHVRFAAEVPQTGWCAPPVLPWLETSIQRASSAFFGRGCMRMGMGGTIPFMRMLGESWPETQYMVTGVLGPRSNAHGPNEFLDIATGKRLTACVARVLRDHAAHHGRAV